MPSDSKIFKLNQDVELPKENGKILDGFYAISSDWETPLVAHDDGLKYSKCFNLTERDEVVIKCKNTYLKKLNFLATESLTSVQASYIAESKKLDIIHFSIFTLPMILFIMLIILNSIPFQFRHKSKLKYIIGFLAFIGIFSVISISHSPFFGIGTVGVIYYFILGLIFAFRKLKRLFLKH